MRNKFIFVASIAVLSAVAPAQSKVPGYIAHGKCDDTFATYQQWLNKTQLPYQAGAKRKQQIVQNYSKLKLQMSMKDVEALLGEPDFSSPRVHGHLSTEPQPEKPICSEQIAYILNKQNENMVDMGDAAVYLVFSPENKLTWAAPQNISVLTPIGDPTTN